MQLESLGKIEKSFDIINNLISTGTTGNLALANSLTGLSTAEKVSVVSRTSLSKAQKIGVLATSGVTGEELKNIVSTNAISTSENKATASTIGLGTAFKGLAASLGISTAALGALTAGLAVLAVGVVAYKEYARSQEELAQATADATQAHNSSTQSLEDHIAKYKELHSALLANKDNEKESYEIKSQLLELQQQLNKTYGDEYGKINLVTDAYRNQTEELKRYNKELASTYLNENEKGIKQATREMEKDYHYNLSYTGLGDYNDEGQILKELAEKYQDLGVEVFNTEDGFSIHLNADATDAYNVINSFTTDLREKAKETGNLDLFSGTFELLSSELNKAKGIIDQFGDTYKTALINKIVSDDNLFQGYNDATKAVNAYNEAVLKSNNVYDDKNVEEAYDNLQKIKGEIQESEEEWGNYSSVMDDVWGSADTQSYAFYESIKCNISDLTNEFGELSAIELKSMANDGETDAFDNLCNSAKEYGLEVEDVINLLTRLGVIQEEISSDSLIPNETPILSVSETITQLNTQLKPTFDALKKSYQSIFTQEDGTEIFTLDNVDLDMLNNVISVIEQMKKEGIEIDNNSFENLAKVLTDTSSTAEQVQQAFNDIATAAIDSLNPSLQECSGENYLLIQSMLESIGVMNSEEVMISSLGYSFEEYIAAKAEASNAGLDLATAAESEIDAFVKEQIESGNCGQALALLQLKKLLVNSTVINTAADVQEIMNLASAAGMGAEVLVQLANAKSILSSVENGGTVSLASYEKALSEVESAKQSMLDWKPVEVKFDGSSAVKDAKKSGKDAGDAYVDEYEKALKELDSLRDAGLISEKEYYDRCLALAKKFFDGKSQYATKYAQEQKKALQGLEGLYSKAASYAASRVDKTISNTNKQKDVAVSALEAEKKARLEVIEAQKKQLELQIKAIDKQIKAKQDEIDKINDAADARKRELDLQKAQYEFARMQNQRTTLQYTEEKGMIYVPNDSGIRDAKEEVDNAKRQIEIASIEKEIDLLERQKDLLNEQIDLLGEQSDVISEYYEKQIEATEKYYDALIESMEAFKEQFTSLSDIVEEAEMKALLEDLGINEEALLSGSAEEFQKLKDAYLGIAADMNAGNESVLAHLKELGGYNELPSYIGNTSNALAEMTANADGVQGIADVTGNLGSSLNNVASSSSTASSGMNDIASSTDKIGESSNTATVGLDGIKESLDNLNSANSLQGLIDSLQSVITKVEELQIALGFEGEAVGGSIVSALEGLNAIDLTPIVTQFTSLQTAVASVTSAIDGSAGGQGGVQSATSSPSTGAGADESSSLNSAIQSHGDLANQVLGGSGEEGDGSGEIGKFGELKTAVDDVINAIGIGGEESDLGSDETTLTGALENHFKVAEEIVPAETELFEILQEVMGQARNHIADIKTMLEDMDGKTFTVTLNVGGMGGGGLSFSTSGINGYATGVKNTKKPEIAWTQEEGRELLISPSRKAMLTPINKGDSVITHEGTENLFKWAEMNPNDILTTSYEVPDYKGMLASSNSNSISVGEVKVVCPGASSKEIAEQAGYAIRKEFEGLALGAYQYSHRR